MLRVSYNRAFQWFGLRRPQFAIYWFFGCLGDLEKFRRPLRGPKRAKNGEKCIFPVLGAVLDETSADQI